MKTWGSVIILLMLFAVNASADAPKTAKVSVSKTGKITYDGKPITLVKMKPRLKALKKADGTVWYYREDGKGEPQVASMKVLALIMECKLTLVMSSKRDFSDVANDQSMSKLE